MKAKVISLPYIFQVLYVLCFTRPRYQVSIYRTIGPLVAYAKTKTQISFALTAKLISPFVFPTQIVQSHFYLNTNFKPLAIFSDCTARFVSDLVGHPEDRFSHNEAHILLSLESSCHCAS